MIRMYVFMYDITQQGKRMLRMKHPMRGSCSRGQHVTMRSGSISTQPQFLEGDDETKGRLSSGSVVGDNPMKSVEGPPLALERWTTGNSNHRVRKAAPMNTAVYGNEG